MCQFGGRVAVASCDSCRVPGSLGRQTEKRRADRRGQSHRGLELRRGTEGPRGPALQRRMSLFASRPSPMNAAGITASRA